MREPRTSAYLRGFEAYGHSKRRSHNPNPPGSKSRMDWFYGWADAATALRDSGCVPPVSNLPTEQPAALVAPLWIKAWDSAKRFFQQ